MKDIKKALRKTLKSILDLLPMMLGILLLISFLKTSWIIEYVVHVVKDNFIGVIIADFAWAISAWNFINSYIIVKKLWDFSSYMLIWTVFMISWVTIWLVQLPLEAKYLWKKFAIIRNILAFVFSILAAYVVVYLFKLL